MNETAVNSPIVRGKRLKQARKVAKLTLKEMSDNSDINYNTLCGWESGKHSGLTEKGAIKIVERLALEGVSCSVEWLLYGVGSEPSLFIPRTPNITATNTTSSAKEFVTSQIQLLKQYYPCLIGLVIDDSAMEPQYHIGDYVAGMPIPKEKLSLASGKTVIVKLNTGKILCRNLLIDSTTGSCSLIGNSLNSPNSIMHNVVITECAIVNCHFKHDPLND
jgi:transcriptional regulator with XRE-family HTH domain